MDFRVGAYIQKNVLNRNRKRTLEVGVGFFDYSLEAPDLDTSNLSRIFNYYDKTNFPSKTELVYNHMRLGYLFSEIGVRFESTDKSGFYYGFSLCFYQIVTKFGIKEYDPVQYGWNSPPGVPGHSSYSLTKAYSYPKQVILPFCLIGFNKSVHGFSLFLETRLNLLSGVNFIIDRTKFPDNNNGIWCNISPFYTAIGKAGLGIRRLL